MELLVCIINREEQVEEILAGFLELGVTGATVIRSEGMGRMLGETPVFAGLQNLLAQSRPASTTILSVMSAPEPLESAMALVADICGDLAQPSTGIMFTIPVSRAQGLARRVPPPPDGESA